MPLSEAHNRFQDSTLDSDHLVGTPQYGLWTSDPRSDVVSNRCRFGNMPSTAFGFQKNRMALAEAKIHGHWVPVAARIQFRRLWTGVGNASGRMEHAIRCSGGSGFGSSRTPQLGITFNMRHFDGHRWCD